MTQVESMRFTLQQSKLLRARAVASGFDAHLHATYSIVALRRGVAEIKSNRWSGTARAGDVFFFNPFEVHSASCHQHDVEYETLYPTEEFMTSSLDPERHTGSRCIQTGILRRTSKSSELAEALFTPGVAPEPIERMLQDVLAECVFSADPVSWEKVRLVRRACELIEKSSPSAIETAELARQLGVHKSHLVRTFGEAVGMAPQKYIRQVRVAKAKELICEGLELADVAAMLDFCDQAHLSREFKKVFGVPPGALSRDVKSYGRTSRRGSST
ncbi:MULTISPECIES: AraC family transcriptional regulator [Neorhizobium]|jgi:AraC-like DNA-binding protein|uniref:helix-turn-helix domain-containing protein n=1 Tax=Neorhizobium sp. T6_25 TaxID=2093833 RepID=UPI000CF845DA|nr:MULTISPECIES: AraC family transcriptional regulator [Neorhizobium]